MIKITLSKYVQILDCDKGYYVLINGVTGCIITLKKEYLDCKYCYQHGWEKREDISYRTLDQIAKYIDAVTNTEKKEIVCLDFMGGEPLLVKEKVLYLYHKVQDICSKKSISLRPGLDMNGTLLDNFLDSICNLNFPSHGVYQKIIIIVDHIKMVLALLMI